MSYIEKEKLIKADIASIENKVRHAFNQGYDLGLKDGKKRTKALNQEPFKPMVEIDLYSVIKQKYIERDVLDKIRAEIETKYGQCDICEYFVDYDYNENDISEYRQIGNIADILQIIDKYKAETEAEDG
jgi:hypothetical protein